MEVPTPKTTAHTTANQQEKKPSEKPNVGVEIPPYLPSQDLMLGAPRKPRIGKSLAFDMEEYCISAVKLYQDVSGHTTLKDAKTQFCPEGSLPEADEETKGELAGNACSILMKDLWLARLSRPDIQRPICELATRVQCWSRNDDRRVHRLMCYMASSASYRLVGKVNDLPKDLKLLLFVDADLCGNSLTSRSTSGGFLVLAGPDTWFPLMWISKRQTATSRSTTEAEMVSLATALFSEAMPCMDLWELLLGRPIDLYILEDNEATIKVAKKGYSAKLRHCLRHHKINLGSVKEAMENNPIEILYCHTNFQAADIFTKALEPHKWDNALALLGIDKADQTATEEPAAKDHGVEETATKKLDQECKMTPKIKGLIAACTAIDSVTREFRKH